MRDHKSGYVGPCLVALVTDPVTCEPLNLHRTWLAPDGSGKAPIDRPRRLMKGHRGRGCIRLWPDDEVSLGLALAEGIESALSVARVFRPAWAAVCAGSLASFPPLAGIECLTIFADHDPAGIEAAEACAAAWDAAGVEVYLVLPPAPGSDFANLAEKAVA